MGLNSIQTLGRAGCVPPGPKRLGCKVAEEEHVERAFPSLRAPPDNRVMLRFKQPALQAPGIVGHVPAMAPVVYGRLDFDQKNPVLLQKPEIKIQILIVEGLVEPSQFVEEVTPEHGGGKADVDVAVYDLGRLGIHLAGPMQEMDSVPDHNVHLWSGDQF
jgi:hypothetical protein